MRNEDYGFPIWKVLGIAVIVVLGIIALTVARPVTIRGNQLGVKETVWNGVSNTVMTPGTYIIYPMFEAVYRYDMTPKVFSMGQVGSVNGNRIHDGADFPEHKTTSSDNQNMEMALKVQWAFDPATLVKMHKLYHASIDTEGEGEAIIENKVLLPRVISTINTNATSFKAIEAYSGEGFIRLQERIRTGLTSDQSIKDAGSTIMNVTIDTIKLDDKYIGEINARQLAEMKTLRAKQEEIAAEAQSKVAKAVAQSDYEKQVVEAERKKQVDILESEAKKQQTINEATAQAERVRLNAEAQAAQVVVAAEAEQKAGVLKAQAILALGQAEAEATKLKMSAYNTAGSQQFVTIEVAKSMADSFKGIQGYIPQGMTMNTLSGNFIDGLRTVLGTKNFASENAPVK